MTLPTRRDILRTATAASPCCILDAKAQEPHRDYDESKLPRYTLPDPLTLLDGEPVRSPQVWTTRRWPELIRLFETNVYGTQPGRPPHLSFETVSVDKNALAGSAERKLITVRFTENKSDPTINLLVYLPKRRSAPVPMFLGVNFRGNHTVSNDSGVPVTARWVYDQKGLTNGNRSTEAARGMEASQWQVSSLMERGYGLATFYSGDVSPDFAEGLESGVEPLFYRKGQTKRDPDQWGALGAWAWGLSRAMDYLVTDPDIDPHRVAVMGHSRMGKAGLWAGARDTRFAMVISNCSGAGGATLARRRFGETVGDLNNKFPWWFCENYRKFSGNEDALPVDQHELLALVAPRPLYVATADQDLGSDPHGQFLSVVAAAPVYRLLGTDGFGATEMPPIHQPILTTMGFHIRTGRHGITKYDWDQYMNFADLKMKPTS